MRTGTGYNHRFHRLRSLMALCPLLLAGTAVPALAQTAVTVAVNAAAPLATIPTAAFGVNTATWDSGLFAPVIPHLLTGAGVTTLRFPGGSTSDEYHWQTRTGGGGNPAITFDKFMGFVQQVKAVPIITVNYGSNIAATGGGDPSEAAGC